LIEIGVLASSTLFLFGIVSFGSGFEDMLLILCDNKGVGEVVVDSAETPDWFM